MRLAVLSSHEGTTLKFILEAVNQRRLSVEVVIVVSNNGNSGALRKARDAGVPTAHISSITHPNSAERDDAIFEALRNSRADVVLLAGYMKKLGPKVINHFKRRILNTHPALLPKFGGKGMYGRFVHEAVVAASEPETGVSIHYVDSEYDTGDIIAQVTVPVYSGDSPAALALRVKEREREIVVETLQMLSDVISRTT